MCWCWYVPVPRPRLSEGHLIAEHYREEEKKQKDIVIENSITVETMER